MGIGKVLEGCSGEESIVWPTRIVGKIAVVTRIVKLPERELCYFASHRSIQVSFSIVFNQFVDRSQSRAERLRFARFRLVRISVFGWKL
jgi:hypothetical protein